MTALFKRFDNEKVKLKCDNYLKSYIEKYYLKYFDTQNLMSKLVHGHVLNQRLLYDMGYKER